MADLQILVCVKVVPKPEEIRVDPQTHLLERVNTRSEINPPDMNAMEMALSLKDRYGGQISLLSMGPPYFEPNLRVALAMGADHVYLLSDPQFAGADTLATTYTLAEAVRKIGKRLYFRRDLFEDWIESNVDFENEVYSEKKRYKRFKTAICGNNEC